MGILLKELYIKALNPRVAVIMDDAKFFNDNINYLYKYRLYIIVIEIKNNVGREVFYY